MSELRGPEFVDVVARQGELLIEAAQELQDAREREGAQMAAAIRAASVELPAGGVKTDRGEVLLRTMHPLFTLRLIWDMAVCAIPRRRARS